MYAFSALAALVAALVMLANDVPMTLIVATFSLAAIIVLYIASALLWEALSGAQEVDLRPAAAIPQTPERTFPLSPAMAQATQLAVTVQGVVLGLVFAFLGSREATATIKVGAVALVVGVILGLLLYALVVIEVPGNSCAAMAGVLFNWCLWSASYGLTCVVCSLFDQTLTKG
ncbi:hypothetical protein [Kitasatospora griseola]|uniref:hypothetical protein n=1 Tax=Kitasatospora griseola TaxID=2064 RepID=UPI0019A36466|nr:hypothetical protein [Kitasatospora griseola]GGQ72091.1 hypothetical protein GCM10010195_29760 [Kitasatospora griseola]